MYCDDSGNDSPKKKQAKLLILQPKKLQLVTDIRKALGMDTNLGRGMPSTSNRMKKSVDEFDAESKSQLVHFVVSAMSNICALICPKDPTTLAQRCAENIAGGYSSKDAKLQGNLKTVIEALPPKSLQRHVLLATVASSYSSTMLKADFGLGDHTVVASQKRFKCLQDGCLLNPDI